MSRNALFIVNQFKLIFIVSLFSIGNSYNCTGGGDVNPQAILRKARSYLGSEQALNLVQAVSYKGVQYFPWSQYEYPFTLTLKLPSYLRYELEGKLVTKSLSYNGIEGIIIETDKNNPSEKKETIVSENGKKSASKIRI